MIALDAHRRWMPYGWMAVALVALYLAWIGLGRYTANQAAREALEARLSRAAGAPVDLGTDLKILQFYASAGQIVRGDHAVACYGVRNASAVRLDPPEEELKPALNRCFAVKPTRDTTYTLRASGPNGEEVSESFHILVSPPPPRILFVAINKKELRRGEPLALCYGVENAASVKLTPLGGDLPVSEKKCLMYYPGATMNYTLTATSAEGRTDQEKFTVVVTPPGGGARR